MGTGLARWSRAADIKEQYRNASVINSERVTTAGRVVFIKWLGTHQEYDRIDAAKVEYDNQANPNGS